MPYREFYMLWHLEKGMKVLFCFSILGFLSRTLHSGFTGQQGKGEVICLIPLYQFHPLHMHLNICQAITAEGSSLHIASFRTRTENL